MYVLSLCRQLCPDKLPVEPDQRLGDGADGEVLAIVGSSDKVIKLGILYEHGSRSIQSRYKEIQHNLELLIQQQPQAYVRVYEHGCLGIFERPWRDTTQQFLLHYYIMEKLDKISEDEKKVFHSVLSHEDLGLVKSYPPEKVREMLRGMSKGLDFDANAVSLFVGQLQASPLEHLDLHPRNIMKRNDGSFACVDADRCVIKEK
jgi:hypothetical protein